MLFRFYTGVQKNAEAASAMLTRLAQRIDVPETQRVFVLAQLYEAIGNRSEAGRFYLAAIKASPADMQTIVLQRAAQFFVLEDPGRPKPIAVNCSNCDPEVGQGAANAGAALAEQWATSASAKPRAC